MTAPDTDAAPAPKPTDMLTAREIAEIRGVTQKTIVNYHKQSRDSGYPPGKFPKPNKILEGRYPRWRRSTIDRYFAAVDSGPGPGDHRTGPDRTPRIRKDAKVIREEA